MCRYQLTRNMQSYGAQSDTHSADVLVLLKLTPPPYVLFVYLTTRANVCVVKGFPAESLMLFWNIEHSQQRSGKLTCFSPPDFQPQTDADSSDITLSNQSDTLRLDL